MFLHDKNSMLTELHQPFFSLICKKLVYYLPSSYRRKKSYRFMSFAFIYPCLCACLFFATSCVIRYWHNKKICKDRLRCKNACSSKQAKNFLQLIDDDNLRLFVVYSSKVYSYENLNFS